jgi:predicted nuclease of predicted toxin-antitoxin system
MKLLFDQNISFRLLEKIKYLFPEAKQVRLLGLENASDMQIWEYAKDNKYCIVTFDADFFNISSLEGHPPKIIWLRTGNATTAELEKILTSHHEIISDFIKNPIYNDITCLEIG